MRNAFYKIRIGMIGMTMMLLVGCGEKTEIPKEAAETPTPEIQEILTPYDLAKEPWQPYQQVEAASAVWNITACTVVDDAIPESGFMVAKRMWASDEKNNYRLQRYDPDHKVEEYTWCYYLFRMDKQTEQEERIRMDFRPAEGLPEQEAETAEKLADTIRASYASLEDISIFNGKLFLFATVYNREWVLQEAYILQMDPGGEVEKVRDISSLFVDGQEKKDVDMLQVHVVSDGTGGFVVIDEDAEEIVLLDGDGILKGSVPAAKGVEVYGWDPKGIPVFTCLVERGKQVIFSIEDGEKKELYNGEELEGRFHCLDEYGRILELQQQSLGMWDVQKGSYRKLCSLKEIPEHECWEMETGPDGGVVLFVQHLGEMRRYRLEQKGMEVIELQLVQLFPGEMYVKECAAQYSLTHPGIRITVVDREMDPDVGLNILAQEMQGEGPDMLLLQNRQTLQTLQEAGLLMEVSEVFSEEIHSRVFDSMMAYGRLEGEQYGIPFSGRASAYMIGEEYWGEQGITLSELMEIAERSPKLERIVAVPFEMTARKLFNLCVVADIENSSFLDPEHGTCSFDSEEFCRVLEFCQKWGEQPGNLQDLDEEDCIRMMKEGKALLYPGCDDLSSYSKARAALGDSFHSVGYPGENKATGLVGCNGCVAVNRNTKYPEQAQDFLRYLLSEWAQVCYNMEWVRRDIYETRIRDNYAEGEPAVVIRDHNIKPLVGRPDGTSYVDEYLPILENASVRSDLYFVQDAVLEECEAFFSGDRSAQETGRILQNRVQIYLDERK